MNTEEYKIEITIILFALFSTIATLIFSNFFPDKQILALTIPTLVLPAIYQIGHIFARESVRAKNEHDFFILQDTLEEIMKENKNLKKTLNK